MATKTELRSLVSHYNRINEIRLRIEGLNALIANELTFKYNINNPYPRESDNRLRRYYAERKALNMEKDALFTTNEDIEKKVTLFDEFRLLFWDLTGRTRDEKKSTV